MLFSASVVFPTHAEANSSAVVSVYVDGNKRVVNTDATTVAEVLRRAKIGFDTEDLVEPALTTEITNQVFNINVYRARPVTIVDNQIEFRVKSAYQNPRLIVENSGVVELYKEDSLSAGIVRDFVGQEAIGYRVVIDRATLVNLQIGNKTTQMRTQAATVGEMLTSAGIKLGKFDIVNVDSSTPISADLEVKVTQIGFETITVEESIPAPIESIYDNNQPLGYEKVEKLGVPGKALITYELEYRNGKEVKRKQIQRVVEKAPEPKVVVVGNKSGTYSGDLWADLRFCETGGDYQKNTGNGYYGAYQFSQATWDRWNTGYARADLAPPEVQDKYVYINVMASLGGFSSQHPGCYKKLGLPIHPSYPPR